MAGPQDLVGLISSVPLFSGLNKSHLQALAKAGKELSYDSGQAILGEGDTGVGFYLVLDGAVEVRHGKKLIAKLGKGQFFGEMSLLDRRPRTADVVATQPTECFVLSAWIFSGFVKANPEIAMKLMEEVAKRLRDTDKKFTE